MKRLMRCISNWSMSQWRSREEVAPGVIVDYDKSNQVVGIEVLYLSTRPQPVNLMDFQFETRPKKLASAG